MTNENTQPRPSKLKVSLQCLIISWVFAVIGLGLGLSFTPDCFSRMGSVVVLLAVMSEYQLLKIELSDIYQNLKGHGAAQAGNTGIPDLSPSPQHQRQVSMSHVTILLGTFILGFGDLWLQ